MNHTRTLIGNNTNISAITNSHTRENSCELSEASSSIINRRSCQGIVRQSSFCIEDSNSTNWDSNGNDLAELWRHTLSLDAHHEDSRLYRGVGALRSTSTEHYANLQQDRCSWHTAGEVSGHANYRSTRTATLTYRASTSSMMGSTNYHQTSSNRPMPTDQNDTDSDEEHDGLHELVDSARRRSHPLTDNVDSVSLERQCRELWRLRAALFENSTVDSWSNYHQRLSRRFDSGYRSLECQMSASLDIPPIPSTPVTTTNQDAQQQNTRSNSPVPRSSSIVRTSQIVTIRKPTTGHSQNQQQFLEENRTSECDNRIFRINAEVSRASSCSSSTQQQSYLTMNSGIGFE